MSGKKRQDLLRAAASLIHRQGYANTSVDQIVAEAGAQKGVFYYYWKSKEEAGVDVLDWQLGRLKESVLERVHNEPLSDVQRIIDTLTAFRKQDTSGRGCPIGNLTLEMSTISEPFRAKAAEALNVIAEAFAQRFSELEHAGKLKAGVDPGEAGRFITAGIEGAIMWHKATRDAEMFADQMEALKEYVGELVTN